MPPRAWIFTGISPYEATNRRKLFSRRKISALFATHRRAAHRLNWRTRNDTHHLGGGSLLLHRFGKTLARVGELLSACLKLLLHISPGFLSTANPRCRSGRMTLA